MGLGNFERFVGKEDAILGCYVFIVYFYYDFLVYLHEFVVIVVTIATTLIILSNYCVGFTSAHTVLYTFNI